MSDEPRRPRPSENGDDDFAGLRRAAARQEPARGRRGHRAGRRSSAGTCATTCATPSPARTPADLGDARTLSARGAALEDNRFVTVAGQAERRYALYIEPHGVRARQTIFRAARHRTRLFVRAADTADRVDLTRALDRPAAPLRRHALRRRRCATTTRRRREVTRYLALDALKAQLTGGSGELRDRIGEPLTRRRRAAASSSTSSTRASSRSTCRRTSSRRWPTRATSSSAWGWRRRPATRPRTSSSSSSPMPDARKNEIVGKLSDKELAFQPHEERYTVKRGELQASTATTLVRSARAAKAPWAQRQGRRRARARRQIGDDAFMLARGRGAGAFWWAPLLLALLLAFAAFNVWYLVRDARRARMTIRIHDTLSRKKIDFQPLDAGQGRHLRLRPDGLRLPARRQRAPAGRLRRRGAPPARARLRRHLRPQHHRRRRQDHQARARARRRCRRRSPSASPTSSIATSARSAACRPTHRAARHRQHRRHHRACARSWSRNGVAYASHGDVYFASSDFPPYGELSRPAARRAASRRARRGRRRARSARRSTSRCGRRPSRASRRGRRRGARAAPAGTSSARRWPSATSARPSTSTAAAST